MNEFQNPQCWVCGRLAIEKDVGYGIFKFVSYREKGMDIIEKERIYYLCPLCRNVVFNDMKRDRRKLFKKNQKALL